MSKWLKEPLLHFLLLGAAIFVLYGWVTDERSADEIFISAGQQDALINTFSRTWQRPPTPAEFKGLLDDYVREEIAFREASAMGLDDDDVIIRRRLRQKLELLAEDVASLSVPADAELQAFLDENLDDYRVEPRFSLQQIYFSPDRRKDAAADARALLSELQTAGEAPDFSTLGDSIALPGKLDDVRLSEIARLFGSDFSAQLAALDLSQPAGVASGQWSGPMQSGFGWHLVLITGHVPGSAPELQQVRDAVQRDWFSLRRREAVEGLYQRLAENYTIEIEPPETGLASDGASEEAGAEGAAVQ
jgi:hypothetical protein